MTTWSLTILFRFIGSGTLVGHAVTIPEFSPPIAFPLPCRYRTRRASSPYPSGARLSEPRQDPEPLQGAPGGKAALLSTKSRFLFPTRSCTTFSFYVQGRECLKSILREEFRRRLEEVSTRCDGHMLSAANGSLVLSIGLLALRVSRYSGV